MTKKDENNEEIDLKEKLKKAQEAAARKDEAEQEIVEKEEGEVEKLQSDLEKMTELAKRTMADMQNLKRRQEEERSQIFTMASAGLIKNCLPMLDNLDRALEHIPEGATEWAKGIEMSITQLHKVFEEAGLTEIAALNEPFNPDLHEAIAQGPGEKDTVVEVFEKGYRLGDRPLRHSKVKVGNGE